MCDFNWGISSLMCDFNRGISWYSYKIETLPHWGQGWLSFLTSILNLNSFSQNEHFHKNDFLVEFILDKATKYLFIWYIE